MMLDADQVACSPASVYRVLKKAGLLAGQAPTPSKKGTGFVQPLKPHQQWHVDVSYLNIAGTFYFLCSILDGYSRFIVHWEIREKMEESDVQTIIQRAREVYPNERPRIITDNGPQFIAKDFKEFIRIAGMTHVKTCLPPRRARGRGPVAGGADQSASDHLSQQAFRPAVRAGARQQRQRSSSGSVGGGGPSKRVLTPFLLPVKGS